MTDESYMPFGAYKNTQMANVPADYLLFLYREMKDSRYPLMGERKEVFEYIEENLDVLKQRSQKNRNR